MYTQSIIMEDSKTDCDSGLSTDSLDTEHFCPYDKLEDESQIKTVRNLSTGYKNATVPFYKEEVLVNDIKRSFSHNTKKPEDKTIQLNGHIKELSNNIISSEDSSFSSRFHRTNSARTLVSQRFSRRIGVDAPNRYEVKTRGRSVSYLEQFKKKNCCNIKAESTTYSTVGSEPFDRGDDYFTCTGSAVGSSRLSRPTSEFEFYDDLMANHDNKSHKVEIADKIKNFDHKLLKLNKVPKARMEKLVVLTKLDSVEINNNKEVDRKKSLQKRYEYANQVKLKNRLKINRQKEKDRIDKFKNNHPIKCNIELEECYNNYKETSLRKQTGFRKMDPFSFPDTGIIENNKKLTSKVKKKVIKQKKPDVKLKTHSVNRDTSQDLSELQQRHEREKALVNSMRNLIVKK